MPASQDSRKTNSDELPPQLPSVPDESMSPVFL